MPTPHPDPAAAAVAQAVAAVDRELAANLELAIMYDQTRQAVVLENGEFGRVRELLARGVAAEAFALVERVYAGIPAVEAAMERRGPAGTIREGDRLTVEAWEGEAREAQHALRAALAQRVPAVRNGGRGRLWATARALLRRLRL